MEQRTFWSVLCCWDVYKLSKVLGYVVKNVEVYLLNRCHVYKAEFLQGCFIVCSGLPQRFETAVHAVAMTLSGIGCYYYVLNWAGLDF
jgi:hypothetical protein